ncbi:ribonuclease domain-containing protein [Streptomyces boninensis]|uniref:ribonuclease domain-containing protein n=1 Tax=Streptomyces boninensis TaxID=2039455 RepID=UPI003B217228
MRSVRHRQLQPLLAALLAILTCWITLTSCGTDTPAPATSATPTPAWARGMDTITPPQLPRQARRTLELIDKGGPFPYEKDGSTFGNYERRLPQQARGYYREYTVRTAHLRHRGPRRIITGKGGERYYTGDHYKTFKAVLQP